MKLSKPKRIMVEMARNIIMTSLLPVEKILLHSIENPNGPPCFIVGPPRSGTTLFYELLIRKYNVSYISNLAHRFYNVPVTVSFLGRNIIKKWKGSFRSEYGHIPGWGSPNEGGWIWNRWFPQRHYLDESYSEKIPLADIRRTIFGISKVMNAPFLNKNVMHSVHMKLLNVIFPGCLFVHIERQPKDNIRSIIRLRHDKSEKKENLSEWQSVKPKEWELFKNEHYIIQACAQVYYIHKNIIENINIIGKNRYLKIDYADICSKPHDCTERFASFLGRNNISVNTKYEIPNKFSTSTQKKLDGKSEDIIDSGIRSLWGN